MNCAILLWSIEGQTFFHQVKDQQTILTIDRKDIVIKFY